MTYRTPLTLLFAAGLALGGQARAEGTLHFANWSDYYPPELLKKFEKDTGIKATLDAYDSNETLLAKLKAGGGAYDVVVPSLLYMASAGFCLSSRSRTFCASLASSVHSSMPR